MVAISLTHESAKEMANRLRQFLAAGGTSIKQTHAYEALAKALGYRDWNTLSGVLQSTGPASGMPGMLLLVDRHAMAAHGVTLAQIESAFRRDFPALLDGRSEWESLCHEQLPTRQLPAFRPAVISISLQGPERSHFHDALMDCVLSVAEPKWTFGDELRPGFAKFTFMFFPERDVEQLLPALQEALARLPAGVTVSAIERVDPAPDHRGFGKWRTDGVSYYVWAWETGDLLLSDQQQLASLALKFNGDELVRLRDVASLHAGMRPVPKREK